ncbi:MAG: hypothetical protein LBB05_03695 [Puniceicoccales bacterium]|jgi:hypothetical protein|nr:hypothetical protein [Puniceicoccales bacterium]
MDKIIKIYCITVLTWVPFNAKAALSIQNNWKEMIRFRQFPVDLRRLPTWLSNLKQLMLSSDPNGNRMILPANGNGTQPTWLSNLKQLMLSSDPNGNRMILPANGNRTQPTWLSNLKQLTPSFVPNENRMILPANGNRRNPGQVIQLYGNRTQPTWLSNLKQLMLSSVPNENRMILPANGNRRNPGQVIQLYGNRTQPTWLSNLKQLTPSFVPNENRMMLSTDRSRLASQPVPNRDQPKTSVSEDSGKRVIMQKNSTLEPMEISALLKNWEKVVHKDATNIPKLTPQAMVQIASQNKNFLIATAAIMDQSQRRPQLRDFAQGILQSVEQGIRESLPAAMGELNRFPQKSQFTERQLKWIKFLAGDTVQGFRYANCKAFREDSDANLEGYHDYVQVVFPSWSPSSYANRDLYIRDRVTEWRALHVQCPTLWINILINAQLNAIRMFHFWGFRFVWRGDQLILVDNPGSPLHDDGNHNALRFTRFIEFLRMFEFEDTLNMLKTLLDENYRNSSSYGYWLRVFLNSPHL